MTESLLKFEYVLQPGWTASGSVSDFGKGKSSLTVNVDGTTATVLRISIEGDASRIATVEYDCNLSGNSVWAWVDTEDTPHQGATSITETTNEDLTYHVSVDVNEVMDEDAKMFLTYISSYSNAQRVLSNFRVYDINGALLNMRVRIPRFTLPRDDWYDEDGRLYRDIIIENLNACEAKLLSLVELDPVNIEPPDISGIDFPDVTLSDDERCILNLKSFIDIMGLAEYPLEINMSATRVNKVTYFDTDYNYHVITNQDIDDISSTNKYVYVDKTTNTVKATSNHNTALGGILLGVYDESRIKTIHETPKTNLNLMYLLGNMTKYSTQFTRSSNNYGRIQSPYNSFRTVAVYNGESKTGSHSGFYTDCGY